MPRPSSRGSLLAASVLCLATHALAAPAPPYPELLKQAQATVPRLAESQAELDQAQGLAEQAGVRPNPTVNIEVENFAGSGPFTGFSSSETTLSAEQLIELGGKRPARVAAGRAEVQAARARVVLSASEFAADLAEAYAEAEAAEARVQLAGQAVSLAQDEERVARVLVQAGREADLRAVQARSGLQAAQSELEGSRAARGQAFARLTAMAAAAEPITSIPSSLLARADRPVNASATDPLMSPAYLAAAKAREAAARRVRIEQLRTQPDVTVSIGARRLAGEDANALVAGVSAPLPIFDRNRGNISAAQAELRAADARVRAAQLEAQAGSQSVVARLGAAQSRLGAARQAEATAEEAYRLSRLGFEGGKIAFSEVVVARRALAEARVQTLNMRVERVNAEAALARLQGRTPFGDQP